MTLAVAAAGVLAGCDGAEKPVLPETGNKKLGDVVKIGDLEFAVTNVAIVQTAGKFNEDGTQKDPTNRVVALMLSLKNTGKADMTMKTANLSWYINGVQQTDSVDMTTLSYTTEKVLGKKDIDALADDQAVAANMKNATYVYDCFNAPAYADGSWKDVTSIQVVYHDAETLDHVVYDIEVPAVVDYKA